METRLETCYNSKEVKNQRNNGVKSMESKFTVKNPGRHGLKYASVSSKRQISIPKAFYDKLGIQDEVTMELKNDRIVIKPVKDHSEDFSEEILSDLIQEGYDKSEILEEFKKRKKKIRPAINRIAEETLEEKSYASLDEMLDDEEDE